MAYVVGDTISQGFYTGVAGESFTYNLSRNPAGATFVSAANITDLGGGDYLLVFTATAAGNYYVHFTGNTSGEVIKGNWTANPAFALASDWTAARAAKLDLIGSTPMIVSSATATNGDITIYKGDDYLNADGRALTWTASTWPTLTGATITATFRDGTKTVILTKTGTVASASSCSLDLTHTDTALFPKAGTYRFEVTAALSGSSDVITLVDGTCAVLVAGGQ